MSRFSRTVKRKQTKANARKKTYLVTLERDPEREGEVRAHCSCGWMSPQGLTILQHGVEAKRHELNNKGHIRRLPDREGQ